jgi:hypothetical protein
VRRVRAIAANTARSLELVFLFAILRAAASCQGTDVLVQGPADATTVDAPKDTAGAAPMDAKTDVAGTVDAKPACPGATGCACNLHSDCPGGGCVPSDAGNVCAGPCSDSGSCNAGAVCRSITTGKGSAKLCVPRNPYLCNPCTASASCTSATDPGSKCVGAHGDDGKSGFYCAPPCASDADCPTDYGCKDVATVDSGTGKFCIPNDLQCRCTSAAKTAGLKTSCAVTAKDVTGAVIGTCVGQRACDKGGLQPCNAPLAKPEVCDGLDNDCDGKPDDGNLCDDSNACTSDPCLGSAGCAHNDIKPTCKDDNPCTADGCDAKKGCIHTPITQPCDDGDACTAPDGCLDGKCKGAPVNCNDGNDCTADACKPGKGCIHPPQDGKCNDGNVCTEKDKCKDGMCTGAAVACDDGNPCTDDACDAKSGCFGKNNAKPCNDGDACTSGDTCSDGSCLATAKLACDDKNSCTNDSCDKVVGCVFKGNGQPCEDGNPCTIGDECAKGACVPGKAAPDATPCGDGKTCTGGACKG